MASARPDGYRKTIHIPYQEAEGAILRAGNSNEIHCVVADNKGSSAIGKVQEEEGKIIISTKF